jgi:aminopeptidase N
VTMVDEAVGAPCPVFVFPNHDDWGFASVLLDKAAVSAIKGRTQQLQDPLARSMLINALYDMTRSARMPIQDYVLLAVDEMQVEGNFRVLAQLSRSVTSSIRRLYRLRPESELALTELLSVLEDKVWQIVNTETDPDRSILWFNLLLESSASSVAQDRLQTLLNETVTLPTGPLSPELRWRVIVTLSGHGASGTDQLISSEAERDPSDQGQKYAIAADAAKPDVAAKNRWLTELQDTDSAYGLAKKRAALSSLFPANQTELQAGQLQNILQSLPLLSGQDPYFMSSYVGGLLRPICTNQSVTAMNAALRTPGMNSTTELFLREAHQADSECLELRELLTETAAQDE